MHAWKEVCIKLGKNSDSICVQINFAFEENANRNSLIIKGLKPTIKNLYITIRTIDLTDAPAS